MLVCPAAHINKNHITFYEAGDNDVETSMPDRFYPLQSIKVKHKIMINTNKRAQRDLGRSTEEKVKGHSEANNKKPQGHNLNNFGRGPFDDVIC